MTISPSLRLGTRGSALALAQAELTEAALRTAHPHLHLHREVIQTTGDRRTDVSLREVARQDGVWDKGVFIKELEVALAEQHIDFAVHSLKDLPSELDPHFDLAAVLPRAPHADVLITRQPLSWRDLGPGHHLATSSVRRAHQLRDLCPGVEIHDIRGNVPTRLRKLTESRWDGILLAAAGLHRLGWPHHGALDFEGTPLHLQTLPPEHFYPAAGQGAIGLEIRCDDDATRRWLAPLNHPPTWSAVQAEREFLRLLGAGCHTPVGVLSDLQGPTLTLRASVYPETGGPAQKATATGPTEHPLPLARDLFAALSPAT